MSVDTWEDGAAYEGYVGRWSRVVAADFIRWLGIPADSAWLDFGCGTGALSQTILAHGAPRLVIGCDRSPGYVDFARRNTSDGRAQFVVAQLPELPRTDDGFDACVAGLVLNFLPSPDMAVATMSSRVRRGGTVGAYVWDYSAGIELMRVFWDAAVAQDPSARPMDEGSRFPLCRAEPLGTLFERAGLDDVAVRPIDVPTVFRDFDDYWGPFLGGQGPAPGYAMSLSADRREQLRETIRGRLPNDRDGQIRLTARAWAVRGVVG